MTQKPVKTITLVQNVSTDPGNTYRDKVCHFLTDKGIEVKVTTVATKDCPVIPPEALSPDLAVILGGDGTFLRAARYFALQGTPLVGVNTGTLGFLTRIEADSVETYLELLVAGKYALEERMLLSVKGTGITTEELALNDVVIKNSNPSQMCSLRLFIDDTLIAVYDADGIIIATPTGSTAYTLSSGGPVISPEVEAISITPICPHSLSAKPVVIPANKTLRVEPAPRNNTHVVCAVDGQETVNLNVGDVLVLERSRYKINMVNFGQDADNFYLLLKQKLQWAMNPRWKSKG